MAANLYAANADHDRFEAVKKYKKGNTNDIDAQLAKPGAPINLVLKVLDNFSKLIPVESTFN